jgi:multicomponent K+:H+ antiporter subunit A
MWGPVALLVLAVVAIGLLPQVVAGALVAVTAQAAVGATPLPEVALAIWHGVTPALMMSMAALAGGVATLAAMSPLERLRGRLTRPDAKRMFDAAVQAMVRASRWSIRRLHTEALPRYVLVITAVVLAVGAAGFLAGPHAPGSRPELPMTVPAATSFVLLAAACVAVMAFHGLRLLTLIVTSIVGLIVSLAFLQFSAPDLALTQISVEVVLTILLLLALNLLPKLTPPEPSLIRRLRDGTIAGIAGIAAAGLAYAVMTREGSSISGYHIAEALPGGGGANIVNVILVDFRGFDTFGEIIVLCIAALVVYAMLDIALDGAAARRLAAMRPRIAAADAHPLVLVVATRVLLPLALTVGAYIFLRGHNLPGGGFIAGLVVAIAIIMQTMASGHAWTAERLRFASHAMLGAGVLIAGLTGLGSLMFGRPFLTSAFGHVHLPLVGDVELATAMLFDAGVFLTVVGTVRLSLAQLALVEQRAMHHPVSPGPMDIAFDRERRTGAAAEPAPVYARED